MASNIQIGDDVYICRSRLPAVNDQTKAFYKNRVMDRRGRSVSIKLPSGGASNFVASKFAHHRVGVAIIAFGDILSESTLIDPLAKTVMQYCRLLFGDDDYVRFYKIRTDAELEFLCKKSLLKPFDHIIFIGHGADTKGAICGPENDVPVIRLVTLFELNNPTPWDFTFLCCYAGRQRFSGLFSKSRCCKSFVAPFRAIHGAISAQFVQTYLVKLLLEGETPAVAHRHASDSTPPGSKFRLWRNGSLLA